MKNKKAIEMPFNWIFAIIAGGIILFLALYMAAKFIGTGEKVANTETAAQLISLLDPFETGLASGKSSEILFKKESRIYLECDELSNRPFGRQRISFSEKNLNKFAQEGEKLDINNKYVFAEAIIQGGKLYAFSKPLFMPFKIGDLIIIASGDYCFYKAPDKIKSELQGLNLGNIVFSENRECKGTKVCFGPAEGCDIRIDGMCRTFECDSEYDYGKIAKDNEEAYYTGDLLYAGIFSSKEIYECNLKRLMNRFNELSLIYLDKIKVIEKKGCSSNIGGKLVIMMNFAKELENSEELILLREKAKEVDLVNKGEGGYCRLY